jgi:MFS transporter, DHA3 family, macrolide efflux protein
MSGTEGHTGPGRGMRTFLAVWLSQSISIFGSQLTFFSITVWLSDRLYPAPGQKAMLSFALSSVALAFLLPSLLLAPVAGAWADRYDRRGILLAADLFSAGLSVAPLLLLLTDTLTLPLLLGLTVLLATLSAFHTAAFESSLASLVPPEHLGRANGMVQASYAVSSVLAPPVAAVLIALPVHSLAGTVDGTPLVLALDCVSFLVGFITLFFLRIPSVARTSPSAGPGTGPRLWADLSVGAHFILKRPALLWLLVLFAAANMAIGPLPVLQPLILKFDLAASLAARGFRFETALALLQTCFGLGAITGGAAISVWGGFKSRQIYGVLGPMVLSGFTLVLLGITRDFYLAAGLLFLTGTVPPMVNAAELTLWQQLTPMELQGRVFSARRVISLCTAPMGTLIAGLASAQGDPGRVLTTLASGYLVFCLAQCFNPSLARLRGGAPDIERT